MRYLKFLGLVLVFFLSMLFFVENNAILSQKYTFSLDLYFVQLVSVGLRLDFMLLISFSIGAIFAAIYFLLSKLSMGRELRARKSKMAELEQELTSLRNLPLDEQDYSSSASDVD